MLPAYELGALSENDAQHFELHLMQCEYCLDCIEELEPYLAILKYDQRAQSEIKQLLAQKKDRHRMMDRIRGYIWPDFPLLFRPAIAYLFVLVTIIVTGLTLMPSEIEINPVQHITLMPVRSATDKALSLDRGQFGVISFIYQDARPDKNYQIEIRNENDEIVMTNNLYHFDATRWGHIQIPVGKMEPGRYQLVVINPEDDPDVVLQQYDFAITAQE